MSKSDALVLVSRAIVLYLIFWVLTDVTYLPERVLALAHYVSQTSAAPANDIYYHYYRKLDLISLVSLLTRIAGLSVLARWIYKCGPGVEELLMPSGQEGASSAQS